MVTFTKEILNAKLHFLCSVRASKQKPSIRMAQNVAKHWVWRILNFPKISLIFFSLNPNKAGLFQIDPVLPLSNLKKN